jgi:DNA-binding protein HU-beta
MNRRELVLATAAHTGLDKATVDAALAGVTDVITAVAAKGEVVTISGFAKFARVDRPARMGRNPATGEQIRIKASRKPRITPLKAFKDSLLSPAAAPKLARGVWPPSATPVKKATTVKKAAVKKAPAKKASAARKAPAKKTTARR